MGKQSCADCYNIDNESVKAEYLVLNHPSYDKDIHVCRHHLTVMLDYFTHDNKLKANEITIIRLEVQ